MATVRTPEGSERFKKPIGSPLDDAGPRPEEPTESISPLRLRALRSLILAKIEVGDTGAVGALTERFRSEYTKFAADKTPAEIDLALNSAPEGETDAEAA